MPKDELLIKDLITFFELKLKKHQRKEMKFDLYTIHLKLILQEELNFFQTFFSAMLAN